MKKLVAVLAIISFNAHAAPDCRELPSCESLGYICSAEECGDLKALSCPFDLSKKACFPKDKECEVGDILYNDLKCHDASCGKTPIAIVYDTELRLAMPLQGAINFAWSTVYADVPNLENCAVSAETKTICGTDGKANTKAIIDYVQESGESYPAAEYCYNSTFGGLPQGTWWLPSVKEIAAVAPNYTMLKNIFNTFGVAIPGGYLWSSTENKDLHAHFCEISTGNSWLNGYYSDKGLAQATFCITSY